jgi:hypothetical protein
VVEAFFERTVRRLSGRFEEGAVDVEEPTVIST